MVIVTADQVFIGSKRAARTRKTNKIVGIILAANMVAEEEIAKDKPIQGTLNVIVVPNVVGIEKGHIVDGIGFKIIQRHIARFAWSTIVFFKQNDAQIGTGFEISKFLFGGNWRAIVNDNNAYLNVTV